VTEKRLFIWVVTPEGEVRTAAVDVARLKLVQMVGDLHQAIAKLFGLDLRAEMVVLSGCSTGLGKVSGDGILGLARAFLYAGRPSVVVSLWDVSDVATAELMDRFYAGLRQSLGKAGSLRRAQLHTLQRYPHPALWAAFSLSGEP